MKKAIIFTILILSLVITGCVSKISPAVENVGDQKTESRQQTIDDTKDKDVEQSALSAGAALSAESVEGTEGWRVYEKEDMDVRLKYHKDWYYDRDEQAEKELSYDLCVGFAESAEILAQGREYPIEFIITSGDQELPMGLDYSKVVFYTDAVDYILATSDKSKYKDILDKMAESFEFISKTADDRK